MTVYAESSAVLAWLLGEAGGEEVRRLLAGASEVYTSVLTLVETDRVLIRAQMLEALKEEDVVGRRRVLARASRRWHLLQLHEEILDRARRPFPGEPIRTLDALHLASALLHVPPCLNWPSSAWIAPFEGQASISTLRCFRRPGPDPRCESQA